MSNKIIYSDASLGDRVMFVLDYVALDASGNHHSFTRSGAFVDNVINICNTSVTGGSKGYSSVAMWHPDDGIGGGRAFAIAIGPNVANEYGNRAFIATNPDTSTDSPPDILISQEQDNGSGYFVHRRAFFDGTNKAITFYGWANASATGAVGVYIDSTGKVGIGTNSLGSAALRVSGIVESHGSAAGLVARSQAGGDGFQLYTPNDGDFRIFSFVNGVVLSYTDVSNEWSAFALNITGYLKLAKTITAGGTTGAQTINKPSGSVNFAAAATSLVVTNNLVTTSSVIIATVATNDTTMKTVNAVAGSGSFTLNANAAATAETRVNWILTN